MKPAAPRGLPLGALLAFFGPCAASLAHAVTVPLFRTDPTVRAALQLEPLLQGGPSAFLIGICSLLPVGQISGRGSLLGALAAGLCGWCVYWLTRDLARRHGGGTAVDAWLALAAAWSCTISAPWLTESVAIGGAATGAALGLTWFAALRRRNHLGRPLTVQAAALLGCLMGTLVAESWWAALAAAAFLVWEPPVRCAGRSWFTLASSATVVASLWTLPFALGHHHSPISRAEPGHWFPWSASHLASQVGVVLGLAAVAAFLLGWQRTRGGLGALAAVMVLDWCLPSNTVSSLLGVDVAPGRQALHLLALGSWATCGSLGLGLIGRGARAWGLYGASAAAPLAAVLASTSAIAGAEDALRVQGQVPLDGARIFSAESLEPLPARAVVLTHSELLTTRLLTSQASHERPDVLVVPLSWLGNSHWMRSLLRSEPRLSQLIRDLNVTGAPSEHALNLLADERPVFVEPHQSWDRRLLEHLIPSPLLAGFSPHALGRSDRMLAWDASKPALARLQSAQTNDPVLANMIDAQLAALEAALAKAGDRTFSQQVGEARSGRTDDAMGDSSAARPVDPNALPAYALGSKSSAAAVR